MLKVSFFHSCQYIRCVDLKENAGVRLSLEPTKWRVSYSIMNLAVDLY